MNSAPFIALLFAFGCAEKHAARLIVEGHSARLGAYGDDAPDANASLTSYPAADLDGVSGQNVHAMNIDFSTPTMTPTMLTMTAPLTALEDIVRRRDLRKGTRFANAYGSAIFGDPGKGEMYSLLMGLGYYFTNYQSIGLDLLAGYIDSEIDDNGFAIGLDAIYRNHFLRTRDDKWTIYFQGGLGLQQQSTEFSGERQFNFRIQIGFGGSFKIGEDARAFAGWAYQHISDAGIDAGIDAGGGFDGPMLYAGVMFPF